MKKLFAILLALTLGVTASALTLDSAESAVLAETTENNAGKPGYNAWTGTTEAYDFEGENPFFYSEPAVIGVIDSETEADNTSVRIWGNKANITINYPFTPFELDRPVTYEFKMRTEVQTDMYLRIRPNIIARWGYQSLDNNQGFININVKNANSGKWVQQKHTVKANSFTDVDTHTFTNVNKIWFFLPAKYGEVAESAYYLWLDDISIIPNYKITYDIGEGTGETPDAEYFLAEEYTLKADLSKITAPSGKVFAYWMDQNGNKFYDTVTPTLGEDLFLCAVYEDVNDSVKTLNIASMRVNTPQGIRIAGFVNDFIVPSADEYGFIATTEEKLGDADAASLTFANQELVKVSAAAYIKGEKDIIYTNDRNEAKELFGTEAIDADGVYFTGVYANIPENAEAYQTKLICRTYVKIGDRYYYGTPVSKSVYEVATAIKAKCEANGIAVPEGVTGAIDVVEG